MMKKPYSIVALCGLMFLASQLSCTKTPPQARQSTPGDGKKAVHVVNYPLQYFAERIAGEKADVVFPAPADVDPAFWTPDDETIRAYQQADLVLLNGAGYAKWVATVSLPDSKLVNTSMSFADKYILIEDAVAHSHGPEGEHAHGNADFNTWLDPQQALAQAEAIRRALSKLMPEQAAVFEENFTQLKSDLQALDASLQEAYDGRPLLASHPVYDYLARRCDWKLESMHWEPDQMPGESQWSELKQLLNDHPAQWMLWEARPSIEIVEKLKEHGLECVVFYPCGNVPNDGDYLEVMQQNVARLKTVFQGASTRSPFPSG